MKVQMASGIPTAAQKPPPLLQTRRQPAGPAGPRPQRLQLLAGAITAAPERRTGRQEPAPALSPAC